MARLLILSCSQRKRSDAALLRAVERYDGPTFRVLRRYIQHDPTAALEVRILSAKLGLISGQQAIPDYDQRMTPSRARELQPGVIAELKRTLESRSYTALFLGLGRDYLYALTGYEELIPPEIAIMRTAGSLGKQLVDLRRWLYGETDVQYIDPDTSALPQCVCLRGVHIAQNWDQIIQIARQALKQGVGNPNTYYAWYALIDETRVAPKWLVSQLTGLPIHNFHSVEARRVLQQLGIPLYSA